MGNQASVEERIAQVDEGRADLHNLFKAFAPLIPKDAEGKEKRSEAWSVMDKNGNGYVSLAEFDGWIRDRMEESCSGMDDSEYYILLWKRFRPCYIRAFNDAKDIATGIALFFSVVWE